VVVVEVVRAAGGVYTAARILDGGSGRSSDVNCDGAKWVQRCTMRELTTDRVLVFCF